MTYQGATSGAETANSSNYLSSSSGISGVRVINPYFLCAVFCSSLYCLPFFKLTAPSDYIFDILKCFVDLYIYAFILNK